MTHDNIRTYSGSLCWKDPVVTWCSSMFLTCDIVYRASLDACSIALKFTPITSTKKIVEHRNRLATARKKQKDESKNTTTLRSELFTFASGGTRRDRGRFRLRGCGKRNRRGIGVVSCLLHQIASRRGNLQQLKQYVNAIHKRTLTNTYNHQRTTITIQNDKHK